MSPGSRARRTTGRRILDGRELGELLRVVRDDDGAVVKLYVATYRLTRAPAAFGVERLVVTLAVAGRVERDGDDGVRDEEDDPRPLDARNRARA